MRTVQAQNESDFSPWHCQHIKDYFASFAPSLSSSRTAREIHLQNLKTYQHWWTEIKTNRTCLACLCHRPEHVLSCGHSICEYCVRVFGRGTPTSEVKIEIDSCVLCFAGKLTVHLKPRTSGISVLSIDGGGVRGIVPLEFLKMVQCRLGKTCAVQDLFDFVAGTSSGDCLLPLMPLALLLTETGGLIAIALFLQGWTVSRSIEQFKAMTKRVFRRPYAEGTLVARCRQYIRSFLSDGYYNIQSLEDSLKESFGYDRKMFDTPLLDASTRVAVTASDIADASTFIFSNYNGLDDRKSKCGKSSPVLSQPN